MKTKLLSIVAISMLLIGSLALAISLTPNAKAAEPPYYLTIATNPPGLPVTEPAIGTYTYSVEHWVNCTAMLEYIDGDVKYIFDHWEVSPLSGDWSAGTGQIWVHVDQNKTATAVYKIQYKFTVIYPWSADWLEQFVPAIWKEGYGFVSGSGANGTYWAWIDQYAKVQAGLKRSDGGIWRGTPWIWGKNYEECVSFVNWTGLGYYISGDGYAWSQSCLINMTGPKSATAEWKYVYYLTVTSDQSPEPAGENWYDKDTIVTLDAKPIVVNWAREWRLDHWEVDGVSRGLGVNPINVTMNTNHTASAFYKCWVFLWLGDDIGNMSGIADNGKWYQEGCNYTFSAPSPVPIDNGHRYEFVYWYKYPGVGVVGYSNPITLSFDATWAGYTLRACYHMHYALNLFATPIGIPPYLYPDSDTSGWPAAGSTVTLKALPYVYVGNPATATQRYKFIQWKNHLGGTNPNNNITFTMMQPWNVTAEYQLEWLATWNHSPSSITVPGSPGQTWIANGTDVWYSLPQTDASGQFAFYYWTINGVQQAQGVNPVHVGIMTGPIVGTATYANKTKIYMDPQYHQEVAPAYCHTFDVTVYATNFDGNRLVNGAPMDIYAFDFVINFNPSILKLEQVSLNLDNFFAPNSYYLGMNVIDNTAGNYHIVATVKGNYTGFSGTKAMFTMTFHVIYDPCYNNYNDSWIYFSYAVMSNHLMQNIYPELGYWNSYYIITANKPMLDIRNHADGTNRVQVDKNVPQTYFDVDVFLVDGVKVHDFYVVVKYDPTQIQADSVVIGDYLKPPYTVYAWWLGYGQVYVSVAQDSSVPLQNGTGLLFTIRFKVVQAIYYKTGGPWYLTSDITIDSPSYLSTYCGTIWTQSISNNLLGYNKCTYVYNPLLGDLDFDGCVTVLDLQLIIDNYHTSNYDVVTDSDTNLFDLVFVALRFGNHV